MARIPLSQLVTKIQTNALSREEATAAFIVEPNPHRPFDFNTYINPNAVDVTNLEALGRNADLLMRGISVPAGRVAGKKAAKFAAAKSTIVAEGDSWFRLPNVITVPNTCIDYLQMWGYPIQNLAHWGDTLDGMLQQGQFWPYVDQGLKPLLFSGGGNDVLGDGHLADFLNLFDVDHAKPGDAAYYVKTEFFDNLDLIASNIESGLIAPMVSRKNTCKIIMHGYDYVIPRPDGPWLGSPMQYQGLDPTFNAGLCQAITRLMIDAYNLKLKALAAKYPGTFVHLDLRGTIGKTEWYDELHGKDAAAQKIAKKFAAVLDAMKITPNEQAIAKLHSPRAAVA